MHDGGFARRPSPESACSTPGPSRRSVGFFGVRARQYTSTRRAPALSSRRARLSAVAPVVSTSSISARCEALDLRSRSSGRRLATDCACGLWRSAPVAWGCPGCAVTSVHGRGCSTGHWAVTEHGCLVIATLAQALNGQRYRQQEVGSLLAAVEAIKQALA